eukprot:4006981-Pyramimonas_sp.AAC.1
MFPLCIVLFLLLLHLLLHLPVPSATPPVLLVHISVLPALARTSILLGPVAASASTGAFSNGHVAQPLGQPHGPGRRGNPASCWRARPSRWENPA